MNRRTLGLDLLTAKTDVSRLSTQPLLDRNLKAFVTGGTDMHIAQIKVSFPAEVAPLLDDLRAASAYLTNQSGACFVVLLVISIPGGFSTLLAGRKSVNTVSCSLPDMLSRKYRFYRELWPI